MIPKIYVKFSCMYSVRFYDYPLHVPKYLYIALYVYSFYIIKNLYSKVGSKVDYIPKSSVSDNNWQPCVKQNNKLVFCENLHRYTNSWVVLQLLSITSKVGLVFVLISFAWL